MGAKKKRLITVSRIKELAQKGSELWDEYGDSIKGIASKFSKSSSPEKEGIVEASLMNICTQDKECVETIEDKIEVASSLESDAPKDTYFEDQQSRLFNVVVKDTILEGKLSNPQQCMAAIQEIYSVADETIKYCAEQETKREEIRAERDVAIARIKEMGELVKVYLEKTYDERSAIFAKQFEAIDAAISDGNVEMLAVTLNSMNALAASSPFKNLADINSVKQGLIEGSEWDI